MWQSEIRLGEERYVYNCILNAGDCTVTSAETYFKEIISLGTNNGYITLIFMLEKFRFPNMFPTDNLHMIIYIYLYI